MMNDPRVSDSCTKIGASPPESRNFGFRVGKKLVTDEILNDIQRANMTNLKK